MDNFIFNDLFTAYAEEETATEAVETTESTTVEQTAEDGTKTNSALSSSISSIVLIVVMIAVFYFLLIRPQRKKDKAVKDMLSALKVGDRICTIGGIYGTITALKEDTVTLAIGGDKAPVVIARWAIRSVEDASTENDQQLSN